jgi:copper(I)-binding protein
MRKIAYLSTLLLAASMTAIAAGPATIEVEHPWARESPPSVPNGAAYMTLVNQGRQPDQLLGVTGDVADKIELHAHLEEGGMMKMRQVDKIEVNPGEPTVLQPGGLHLMLIGLKKPLVAGQKFTLQLNFANAGKVPAEVAVSHSAPEHHH